MAASGCETTGPARGSLVPKRALSARVVGSAESPRVAQMLPPGVARTAVAMLTRYRLHPAELPTIQKVSLDGFVYASARGASEDVALDLSKYKDESVTVASFVLRERSQARRGRAWASFAYDSGRVVGAWLSLEGYAGGVMSLRYRDDFHPENLDPARPRLPGVKLIEIAGRGIDDVWYGADLRDQTQIDRVLRLLERSVPRRGELPDACWGGEEYDLWLNYEGGERARIDYHFRGGREAFDIGPLGGLWYYKPPAGLRPELRRLLKLN